jgi:hypothetical protein
MMNIKHHPLFDTARAEKLYSEKDNVTVKYVCTSAIGSEAQAMDIFYRETPHPKFGNRYFGLYRNQHFASDGTVMITNADKIEEAEFGMIEGAEGWEYSQHRHDYRSVGDCAVDGGRSYFRRVGDLSVSTKYMKIVDGEFVEVNTNCE